MLKLQKINQTILPYIPLAQGIYLLRKLKQWVLPHTCLICGNLSSTTQDLCLACKKNLPWHKPTADMQVLFLYQPPITQLILNLKFQHALVNAKLLGELMAEKILTTWYRDKPLPTAIIPIPLHTKRLRVRGFNQALEIARPIAKMLKLPIITDCFARTKATAAQATLPAKARVKNMKNAFKATKKLNHSHIAIIDDVTTTGRTIKEFCHVLTKAGIQQIDIWCCARPLLG